MVDTPLLLVVDTPLLDTPLLVVAGASVDDISVTVCRRVVMRRRTGPAYCSWFVSIKASTDSRVNFTGDCFLLFRHCFLKGNRGVRVVLG